MIAVIDYGMGNLRSIAKALEYVGAEVIVTRDAGEIRKAERIVLPGVGAFGNGMENLHAFGLIPVLEEEVLEKRKPFWGICLGMQLLARHSEEFGEHEGLGWVPADVKKFAFPEGSGLRIPHVGWNDVAFVHEHPVAGAGKPTDFYFVHSYYMTSEDPQLPLGTCDYGGQFVACIARENIIATQFHPEKSQRDGLNMLQRFCAWQPSPQF